MKHVIAGMLVLLTWTGCAAGDTVSLAVGDHVFQVEIADTPDERQRGLMFRDEMAADAGMLFVFPDSRPRSFWMKDTRIPLSIAYVAADGRILEIHDMEPLSTTPVPSRYPARYALEVNQGRFDEVGVTVDDRIDLSAIR